MCYAAFGKARAKFIGALLVLFVCGFISRAGAAPLAPGAAFAVPAEADPTGGLTIADSGVVPVVASTFTGTLVSHVISGDPSNPYVGSGGLTFTYLLTNDITSPDPIERFTISSFIGFLTDVNYQTPAAGIIPAIVNRTANQAVVGFSYFDGLGGVISPGQSSALMVVQTDATDFTTTLASIINGSVATPGSFAPLPNIPEPASLGLVGYAALLALCRRRSI